MSRATRILVAIVIDLLVTIALFFGFGIYTWTAIHNAWSQLW